MAGQIDSGDLDAFLGKLESWAEGLNSTEQTLLGVVLEQAARGEVADLDLVLPQSGDFGAAIAPFLRDVAERTQISVGDDQVEDIEDLEPSELDAEAVVGGERAQPAQWVNMAPEWIQAKTK